MAHLPTPGTDPIPQGGMGWEEVKRELGDFQGPFQNVGVIGERRPGAVDPTAALYGGQYPTATYFNDVQYLPMNANFYMPPGSGLPYMDPYGMMNPGALPPIFTSKDAKKASLKKGKPSCC